MLVFPLLRGFYNRLMIDEFDYAAEESVFAEGSHGDGFYILKSGAVDAVKDGQIVATFMNPGTVFGEIGFILEEARTTSIIARTESKILRVTGEDLEDVIKSHPKIAATLLVTLAKRLETTTQKLYSKGG